tara:strand:+ start:66 stop:1082 length:1017 start_codon:yes stop_codon:yes gene_type:complete
MARRSDKLKEELAALDREVIKDRGTARRFHKAIPIIGAVVAMVGFGTVTWYAYNQGILEGSEKAAPYLRPKGALKTTPVNPGGFDVPNRDKYVFNTLEQREDDRKVERLLPPPEEPKKLPKPPTSNLQVVKPQSSDSEQPVKRETAGREKFKPRTANETLKQALNHVQQDAPPPLPRPGSETAKATTPETKAKLSQAVPQNGPIKLTPGPKKQIAKPTPPLSKPDVQATAKRKPTALTRAPKLTAPQVRPRVTRSAGYYIQLGALRSKSAAVRAWRVAQQKNRSLLGGRDVDVQRAKVPNKGVYYRVQSGPFAGSGDAKNLCEALKRRKQGCFVVRRR